MKTITVVVFVALLASVAAGCGQSGARAEAQAVTERFYAALAAGRGAVACRQLSTATAQAVAQQARRPCREAVLDLRVGEGGVERVHVAVTSAQVVLAGGENAFLDREQGGWRLDAVGCTFETSAPRERPADCEAKS
jgi:hypothetical protein